ncbi:MAG: gliding motility-associated C-terminal domain-containing protein [Bacteroidota bacterium]
MRTSKIHLLYILLVLFLCTKISKGQNGIVLNQNSYITLSNAAYLVIDNPNANAIITVGTGGNIISENELNVVKWNINTNTGNYIVPFTTTTNVKIPLSVNLVSAGTGPSGAIIFSTYETTSDANTIYPSDVTNMNSGCSNSNGLFALDRFWRIDAGSYSTKPTPVINFGYNDAANELGGTNTILESRLRAQRFNSGLNSWETPQKLYGTGNPSLNTISGVNVTPADFYKSWTIIDTNSMYVTKTQTIILCQGDSLFVQGAYQNSAGTFYDTINAIAACDTSLVTNLSFNNPPVATVTSQINTNCNAPNGGSAVASVLGGTGSLIYSWTNGGGTNLTASGLSVGTYIFNVTDSIGCSDTASVVIIELPPPIATITSHTNTNCNSPTLGSAVVSVVGGTGTLTYSWTNGGGTNATASGLTVGTYIVTVSDSFGCSDTASVTIIQLPPPIASIASQTNINCNSVNSGSAVASVSGGMGTLTYSWTNGAGTLTTASALAAGTYVFTVTDSIGCTDTASVIITQPAPLTAQIASVPGCGLTSSAQVTSVTGGTGSYTYLWSPSGGTNTTASGLSNGTYICTITDNNNCSVSDTTAVVANPIPAITVSSDTTINFGYSTTLQATGGATYTWTPSATLNCTNCTDPLATPLESTTYCVTVADTNGCIDSGCVYIQVNNECDVMVPQAFSPNGDGANDLECIYGKCSTTIYFAIYDRWGEKVFETTDAKQCWDGTYKGTQLNTAVFVYYLQATLMDGSTVNHKGNITLVR